MAGSMTRKTIRGVVATVAGGLLVMGSCVADVSIPGGTVLVDQHSVFVRFLGLVVDVQPGQVFVDVPGIELDIHHP